MEEQANHPFSYLPSASMSIVADGVEYKTSDNPQPKVKKESEADEYEREYKIDESWQTHYNKAFYEVDEIVRCYYGLHDELFDKIVRIVEIYKRETEKEQ